jgi:HlyD family secretion protein
MPNVPNSACRIGRRALKILTAALLGGVALVGGVALLAVPSTYSAVQTVPSVPRPPSVSVMQAGTGTLVDTILVTGTLVARDEVLVSSEIEGLTIVELLADEGDRVLRGQVLARLSSAALEAQLAQTSASTDRAVATIAQVKSQIAEAEATYKQAEAAFTRARTLQGSGNASAETLEQRQASAQVAAARVSAAMQALRVAEAEKGQAEARHRELQVNFAQTEIRAPAAGVISRRTAKLGSLASMASEPLFRIVGNGTVELEAEVPETVLARLSIGQAATVRPAGRTEDVAARVRLIVPEVNRTTRLGHVRLTLESAPGLTIGAFARGTIEVDRRKGTLVPLSSVLHGADGPTVQVVSDGVVETRPIVLGLQTGGKAEIREGVTPGEYLVALSGTFVRNGDQVRPIIAPLPPGLAGIR